MSESAEKPALYFLIQGQYYLVERIMFEVRERVVPANGWKLTKFDDKLNHSPYCVIRQPSGRMTCDCADFTLVGQREQRPCKHITACQQIGLFQ